MNNWKILSKTPIVTKICKGVAMWEARPFGVNAGIIFTVKDGDQPNWFWRKMQYLCFGIIWKKKN